MNALWNFNVVVEFVGSIMLLALGISGCLYAYGFSSGRGPTKRFHWRTDFRGTLRWLAPLLVLLSLAALLFQVHELRISDRAANQPVEGMATGGRLSQQKIHVTAAFAHF